MLIESNHTMVPNGQRTTNTVRAEIRRYRWALGAILALEDVALHS